MIKNMNTVSTLIMKLKQLKKSRSTSELYQEQVHHSTLGLDMALRLIHKFVNLKYDSDMYTFIFVHELGKDFMSFDGYEGLLRYS